VPIIGNGDIWTVNDIDKILDHTGCHSVMIGRGALKTPWLAKLYKNNIKSPSEEIHLENLRQYFENFIFDLESHHHSDEVILKRLKSVSRYIFDHFQNSEEMKRNFMRTQELESAKNFLRQMAL
jgi:tRNA-dihydrouridine synthase